MFMAGGMQLIAMALPAVRFARTTGELRQLGARCAEMGPRSAHLGRAQQLQQAEGRAEAWPRRAAKKPRIAKMSQEGAGSGAEWQAA